MTPLSHLRPEDFVSLVTTGEALAGTIDHEALLTTILKTAGQLTDSPDGAILLYDPRRNSLYFAEAIGSKAADLLKELGEQATRHIPLASKAGRVFQKRETEVALALEHDPSHFKGVDQVTGKKTESMITVPLVAAKLDAPEQECIGVMQVLNKRAGNYDERDRVLLEQFASQAAIALRNARFITNLLAHRGLYSRGRKKRSAQELIKLLDMEPHHQNLTIMFADLRGFRSLCQRITIPQTLTEMLNEFLSMLVDRVLSYDGVVNKYLGDGILAFFPNEDHEVSAVNCAFDMVDAFGPLKDLWITKSPANIRFLDIGIGICTDWVTIGSVGSKEIKDYTVIGNPVNLAAAFEYEARGGKQVLVDEPTYHKVKGFYTADDPVDYELRLPGQPTGHMYKQFNLHREKPAESPPVVCFISFSQADETFVNERVVEVLKGLKGKRIQPWIAPRSIEAGKQWPDEIIKGLKTADYLIVVVSENSAKSDWVKREIKVAYELPALKDRIIPVRIDETPPKDVDAFLSSIQAISYKELAEVAQHFSGMFDASRPSP